MIKDQKEIIVKENKDQQNSDMQMDLLNFSEESISSGTSKKKSQKMEYPQTEEQANDAFYAHYPRHPKKP